jgi:hypothetical protein
MWECLTPEGLYVFKKMVSKNETSTPAGSYVLCLIAFAMPYRINDFKNGLWLENNNAVIGFCPFL